MAQTAVNLVEHVLPTEAPLRQFVLTLLDSLSCADGCSTRTPWNGQRRFGRAKGYAPPWATDEETAPIVSTLSPLSPSDRMDDKFVNDTSGS